MYTYFIADDETKIRQGLRQLIDWEELGFYCVGEAWRWPVLPGSVIMKALS